MPVKYDVAGLQKNLIDAAKEVAAELTREFFREVDISAPVENGHLHQTLGMGLQRAGLPEANDVVQSMLSKGSGDPVATSAGYGETAIGTTTVQVVIGTTLGFVNRLDDGEIFTPDVYGSRGFKEGGEATQGELYAPRKNDGQMGFLMWTEGGAKHFTRSVGWGPLGFFSGAAFALETKAQEMGLQ